MKIDMYGKILQFPIFIYYYQLFDFSLIRFIKFVDKLVEKICIIDKQLSHDNILISMFFGCKWNIFL